MLLFLRLHGHCHRILQTIMSDPRWTFALVLRIHLLVCPFQWANEMSCRYGQWSVISLRQVDENPTVSASVFTMQTCILSSLVQSLFTQRERTVTFKSVGKWFYGQFRKPSVPSLLTGCASWATAFRCSIDLSLPHNSGKLVPVSKILAVLTDVNGFRF